jgi:hypothetical protein
MLGLSGQELIKLLELVSLHGTGAKLHELLQFSLLAAAANLERQEILHTRIIQHCHVSMSLSIATFVSLSTVIAQLIEFGAGTSRLTEVIEHRLAISSERGLYLPVGAGRLSTRFFTVTDVILIIVIFLGANTY